MISSQRLRQTLAYLDLQYYQTQSDPDPVKSVLYCKLALLELCGWIEECLDSVAFSAVKTNPTPPSKAFLVEKIERVHGFTYQDNARSILLCTLGVAGLDALETIVDQNGSLTAMKGWLTTLNGDRRTAAHTHLGTPKPYSSPSTIIQTLNNIEPVIIDIYNLVKI